MTRGLMTIQCQSWLQNENLTQELNLEHSQPLIVRPTSQGKSATAHPLISETTALSSRQCARPSIWTMKQAQSNGWSHKFQSGGKEWLLSPAWLSLPPKKPVSDSSRVHRQNDSACNALLVDQASALDPLKCAAPQQEEPLIHTHPTRENKLAADGAIPKDCTDAHVQGFWSDFNVRFFNAWISDVDSPLHWDAPPRKHSKAQKSKEE